MIQRCLIPVRKRRHEVSDNDCRGKSSRSVIARLTGDSGYLLLEGKPQTYQHNIPKLTYMYSETWGNFMAVYRARLSNTYQLSKLSDEHIDGIQLHR